MRNIFEDDEEIIFGTYEISDETNGIYKLTLYFGSSSLDEYIRIESAQGTLGNVTLSGVYTPSDDYMGTFTTDSFYDSDSYTFSSSDNFGSRRIRKRNR